MGVGKESDILLVTSPSPKIPSGVEQSILKIHRIGRTSFRTVATNRAYHGKRTHASWQYLSRLSAQREYAAMRALDGVGFRVPRPIAQNRHTVVMGLVPGVPLRQLPISAFDRVSGGNDGNQVMETEHDEGSEGRLDAGDQRSAQATANPRDKAISTLYTACIELTLSLASVGVIHGDLNEFNILVEEVSGSDRKPPSPDQALISHGTQRLIPHLIDFPQIISLSHPSAPTLFARDVAGIKSFFRKRYRFESTNPGPSFSDALARLKEAQAAGLRRQDVDMEAAGFKRRIEKELESYYHDSRVVEDVDSSNAEVNGNNAEMGPGAEDVWEDGETIRDLTSKKSNIDQISHASALSEALRDHPDPEGRRLLIKGLEYHPLSPVAHGINSDMDPNEKTESTTTVKAASGWSI